MQRFYPTPLSPRNELLAAPYSVMSFSLAVLRVGRRLLGRHRLRRKHFGAEYETNEFLSVAAVRNAVGPSVRRYAHAPHLEDRMWNAIRQRSIAIGLLASSVFLGFAGAVGRQRRRAGPAVPILLPRT